MASSSPGQTNLGVSPNVGGLLCYVPCCIGLIFSIPGGLFELALGIWLLIKGFQPEAYGQDA